MSYSKSGTFMAYAAHGLNIVAVCADRSKEEPLCLLIDPRELLQGLSETELKLRAERLRAWQKRTSSWQIIAAKFADALQLAEINAVGGEENAPSASTSCPNAPRVREDRAPRR